MNDNFTMGIMALAFATLIISSLPSALMQEGNTAINNTAMNNPMLNNTAVFNKTNSPAEETSQSSTFPSGIPVLHIGKGLNEQSIVVAGAINGDIISPIRSISYQSPMTEIASGNPAKPMKDLEKVVFICNIM